MLLSLTNYNSFFSPAVPLTALGFVVDEIFSRTFNILSLVSTVTRSTSDALKSVVGIGSRTTSSDLQQKRNEMGTLNLDCSTLETSFFNTKKTFIVCYDDRDNRNTSLNSEMECSLFERKEHGTISVGTCSFWENPYTLLEW